MPWEIEVHHGLFRMQLARCLCLVPSGCRAATHPSQLLFSDRDGREVFRFPWYDRFQAALQPLLLQVRCKAGLPAAVGLHGWRFCLVRTASAVSALRCMLALRCFSQFVHAGTLISTACPCMPSWPRTISHSPRAFLTHILGPRSLPGILGRRLLLVRPPFELPPCCAHPGWRRSWAPQMCPTSCGCSWPAWRPTPG